jgi:Arc/MetJ-type ribon-helix-helix transcriptional regulator
MSRNLWHRANHSGHQPSSGEFASRSDVVRDGILRLVDERRRRAIGDEIIAGCLRVPETSEELASTETNA